MILFVRADKGKVNHIILHRQGIDIKPKLKGDVYHTEHGDFTVDVAKDDSVKVKLNKKALDGVKVNDLYKFEIADTGEPDNTPALGVSVADGIGTGERLG
jgi:hypothetical protein